MRFSGHFHTHFLHSLQTEKAKCLFFRIPNLCPYPPRRAAPLKASIDFVYTFYRNLFAEGDLTLKSGKDICIHFCTHFPQKTVPLFRTDAGFDHFHLHPLSLHPVSRWPRGVGRFFSPAMLSTVPDPLQKSPSNRYCKFSTKSVVSFCGFAII